MESDGKGSFLRDSSHRKKGVIPRKKGSFFNIVTFAD